MDELIGQDMAGAGGVVDSNTETFVADVVEASMEVPVIVDFWAPWCEPCKTLGPLIEKVVNATGGKVKLVKVDIDQNQEIAAQMRIQSIPAVFAFKNGQPVDGFVGAQSESQIKTFVERLSGPIGPTPIEQAMEQAAQALAADDFIHSLLVGGLGVSHVVVGYDFAFGQARGGNFALLQQSTEKGGYQVDQVSVAGSEDGIYSASEARALLGTGDVQGTAR